jgi:hypothetical protein
MRVRYAIISALKNKVTVVMQGRELGFELAVWDPLSTRAAEKWLRPPSRFYRPAARRCSAPKRPRASPPERQTHSRCRAQFE